MRFACLLVAMLVAWPGGAPGAAAVTVPDAATATYTYDISGHPGPQLNATIERGPPASHDSRAYDAIDSQSRGRSARPDVVLPQRDYGYDDLARFVQIAPGSHGAEEQVDSAEAGPVAVERSRVAANAGSRLGVQYGTKIEKQLGKRGWTHGSVEDLINNPSRTVATRDTRHLPGGGRNDAPASAYINRSGGYAVRNDETGDLVQVSNLNDPNWKSPW
jgi:hypothetical protein